LKPSGDRIARRTIFEAVLRLGWLAKRFLKPSSDRIRDCKEIENEMCDTRHIPVGDSQKEKHPQEIE
jgi:hypothetical protein